MSRQKELQYNTNKRGDSIREIGRVDIQAGKPGTQEQVCMLENPGQRKRNYCDEKPLPSQGWMMHKKELQYPHGWCTGNKNKILISPRNIQSSNNCFTTLVSFLPSWTSSGTQSLKRFWQTPFTTMESFGRTSPSPRGNSKNVQNLGVLHHLHVAEQLGLPHP